MVNLIMTNTWHIRVFDVYFLIGWLNWLSTGTGREESFLLGVSEGLIRVAYSSEEGERQ